MENSNDFSEQQGNITTFEGERKRGRRKKMGEDSPKTAVDIDPALAVSPCKTSIYACLLCYPPSTHRFLHEKSYYSPQEPIQHFSFWTRIWLILRPIARVTLVFL